ncbi:efflux RND transporter permease subunit [Tautonia marina]|uniref:efflux RND transporter permease subunit n=1 Tax=Tautonia marina TaxID=2653855 RepID=UPI001F434E9F|nr:MMPL family transporter [Tautonia marina]
MIALLLRARLILFAGTTLALVLLWLFGKEVNYDQSIESFFAADDPNVVAYRQASSQFGNDQFVFIAYHDPDLLTPEGIARVAELSGAIQSAEIEGVVSVQSLDAMPLFWQLDDALLALEKIPEKKRLFLPSRAEVLDLIKQGISGEGGGQWATPTISGALRSTADQPDRLADLRDRITAHPLLLGTLVDRSGTYTALMTRLKSAGEHDVKITVEALRTIADDFAERHDLDRKPAVVGPPVLLADGFRAIEIDGQRLATVGMLLIGAVTLIATRSLWWALVPLIAGWTVWLATSTLLGVLDLKLSLSSGPMIAQIIVLTMPAASHLALHFREDLRRMADRRDAARETLQIVSEPIFWCALTTTIGYGALATSNVMPIRQFGTVLAIATAAAALLTLLISPGAMIPPFRIMEIPVRFGSTSRIAGAMSGLIARVYRRPAPIVFGTLIVVTPLAAGMPYLQYESNYINAFRSSTRVVQDYRFIEEHLGGIGLAGLIVPTEGELTPETLDRIRTLDRAVLEIAPPRNSEGIAYVTSLATVLDPDERLAELDPDRAAWLLSTKLDLISATPQAELLGSFWDPETGWARSMVRLSESQPAPAKIFLFDQAEELAQDRYDDRAYLTGLSHLLTQTTRGVIATQWTTLALATTGILVMLTLAFRGPKLAVLAILPTMLAVGLVLGLMGWLGVKLDLATALVASVALGLSIDDTFHCLLQFRRRRQTQSFEDALFTSYTVTGPGVLLSSLAVALGFTVLWFSEFVPFATFGLMVAIATVGSTIGNIILLPACLSLAHRWRNESGADGFDVLKPEAENITPAQPTSSLHRP